MATEIELKLRLEPKEARKLPTLALLAGASVQKQHLLNTYYDTPALALRQQRIALRFRKKGPEWLLTVKSAEPASGGLAVRSEWETRATPGQFDFNHVDAGPLRNLLERERERLTPIFTTDFQRQIWQIAHGESLIELALDRGQIIGGERQQAICEIELELLSGRVDDLFGLTRQLQKHLRLHPAIASKAERGYQCFLNEPERPFKARPVAIQAEQSSIAAFRAIALGCLEHFQRNESGLLSSDDAEFIHQARVALRRLRSAIKLFAPVLPAGFVTVYGQSWQTLASALGEARNWDVFLEETLPPLLAACPHNHELHHLRSAARHRVKTARHTLGKLLALQEYPRLLLEFTAAVHALQEAGDQPLSQFARQRIAAHTRSVRKMAVRYAELSPAERHKMRLRFKKLRYAMEFMLPLLPARRMKSYLAALSALQDELGQINDRVTAETLIREVLGPHAHGPALGWVSGQHALLVERLPELLDNWLQHRG